MTTQNLQHDRGHAVLPRTGPGAPQAIAVPEVAMPADVEEALAAHTKLVESYYPANEEAKAAEAAHTQARADDIRDDAELVAAGKKPIAAEKRQAPKAEANLVEARRRLEVINHAGERTEQVLAEAVRQHLEGWLEELTSQQTEAEREYGAALGQLREAANKVALARGAVRWLEADEGRGELPRLAPGDKLSVSVRRGVVKDDRSVPELLQALGSVTRESS